MSMHRVNNISRFPFTLQTVKGVVTLPALDSVDAEFTAEYLDRLKSFQMVTVEEIEVDKPKRGRPRKEIVE